MQTLRHHFKAWREKTTELNQEEVASRIGRNVSQVSRIESGRDVTLGQLSDLAAAIGQKNPLRLLFPPGSGDLELIDLLWDAMSRTPAERRIAARLVKSLFERDDEAA